MTSSLLVLLQAQQSWEDAQAWVCHRRPYSSHRKEHKSKAVPSLPHFPLYVQVVGPNPSVSWLLASTGLLKQLTYTLSAYILPCPAILSDYRFSPPPP